MCCPFRKVADFLISLFDKWLAFTTITGYRPAIAAVHKGSPDGSSISSSSILSEFARSFFLKRPPLKHLVCSWSLPLILPSLAQVPYEPSEAAFMQHLSEMWLLATVRAFIMAVARGHTQHYQRSHHGCGEGVVTTTNVEGSSHIRFESRSIRLILVQNPRAGHSLSRDGPTKPAISQP